MVIKDYSVFDDIVDRLRAMDYIHEGNLGIEDREAFSYSHKPHQLYVCPQQSKELHRHLAFRDFLGHNPEAVKKYELIKELYGMTSPKGLSLQSVASISSKLWENRDIIDEFLLSDFKKMDEEEMAIVRSWKKSIQGGFIVDRHLNKGSVLILLFIMESLAILQKLCFPCISRNYLL